MEHNGVPRQIPSQAQASDRGEQNCEFTTTRRGHNDLPWRRYDHYSTTTPKSCRADEDGHLRRKWPSAAVDGSPALATINGMELAPLDILYDDGPVLVVNKPAGLLTQAPAGIDSLEVRVKDFYRGREGKPEGANIYLGLPHRLDRPVSGTIVLARHVRAAQRLAAQFENRTVSKSYWAVVEGDVEPDEGTWQDYLHKRHGMAQAEVVAADHPAAKHAVLRYCVRGRCTAGTWLEIELETGRTHQIRVQAASRGHAVVGDSQYGSTTPFGDPALDLRDRPIALHARQLGFRHPMTQAPVDVVASLPGDWDALGLPLSHRSSESP
jgi:23S rRNA pseudouridine1911/1915/1917 synthase